MPVAPLHDPITVAVVEDPDIATTVRTRVDLDVDRFWTMVDETRSAPSTEP